MVSCGSGARFGTVTEKPCSASRPPGSLAVTVTDALPGATPATVTVVSDMDAVAIPESDDMAEYASASPLGSVKHAATVVVSPAWTVTSAMGPQAEGGLLALAAGEGEHWDNGEALHLGAGPYSGVGEQSRVQPTASDPRARRNRTPR